MVAVIGQILLCLLFAATVGFLTAWFLRRSRVDELTLEVERLKQSSGSFSLGPLEKKVDALGVLPSSLSGLTGQISALQFPKTDLSGLEKKIDGLGRTDLAPVHATLEDLKKLLNRPQVGGATTVDFSGLEKRLETLSASVEELKKRPLPAAAAAAMPVDLNPLLKKQDALQAAIDELKKRPLPQMPDINLSSLEKKLDGLSGGHGDLTSKLTLVSSAVGAFRSTDVSGVEKRLEALAANVDELKKRPLPQMPTVDLSPLVGLQKVASDLASGIPGWQSELQNNLNGLKASVAELQKRPAPQFPPVDFAPTDKRIDLLQMTVDELKKRPAPHFPNVDLHPTEKRLDALTLSVDELKKRPVPQMPDLNLNHLEKKLDVLTGGHGDLTTKLSMMSTAVAAFRSTDVSPLERKVEALAIHVEELKKRPAPQIPTVDLQPLEKRIGALNDAVEELKKRPVPHFPAVDLHPTEKRLDALNTSVEELKKRPVPQMPELNLSHLEKKLDVLTGGHGDLTSKLALVSGAVSAFRSTDVSGLEKRVDLLATHLDELKKRPAPQMPQVDLNAVEKRLDSVSSAVDELKKRPAPQMPQVDLSAVEKRLDSVSASVDELKKRPMAPMPDLDLSSVYKRQDALQSALETLRQSLPKSEKVDFSGIDKRLELVAHEVSELKKRPQPSFNVDWKHVDARFAALDAAFEAQRNAKPDTSQVNQELNELTARFSRFEQHLSSFKVGAPTDLTEVYALLRALEEEIKALRVRLSSQSSVSVVREVVRAPVKPRAAKPVARQPKKQVKDDLILIQGVGPVLQRMLNKLGVYRFEQVMRWNQKDIDGITLKLPNFKGRIEREGWVASARTEYTKKYGKGS